MAACSFTGCKTGREYSFVEREYVAHGNDGFFGHILLCSSFSGRDEKSLAHSSSSSHSSSSCHSLPSRPRCSSPAPAPACASFVIKELFSGKNQTLSYQPALQLTSAFMESSCEMLKPALRDRESALEPLCADHVVVLKAPATQQIIAATRDPISHLLRPLDLQQCVDMFGLPATHLQGRQLKPTSRCVDRVVKEIVERACSLINNNDEMEDEDCGRTASSATTASHPCCDNDDNNDDASSSSSCEEHHLEFAITPRKPLHSTTTSTPTSSLSDFPLPTSWVQFLRKRACVQKEITAMLAMPEHPNLMQMVDYGEKIRGNTLRSFIVLPFYRNGDLMDRLNKGSVTVSEAMDYFSQIASGVAAMHQAGLCHRDLKLDNVLVGDDGKTVIVADMGFATSTISSPSSPFPSRRMNHNKLGSPLIRAPEIWEFADDLAQLPTDYQFLKKGYHGDLADVWSLGIILFNLVTKNDFWCFMGATGSRWSKLRLAITSDMGFQQLKNKTARLPDSVPAPIARLILDMLTVDPEERPTVSMVLERVGGFTFE